MISVDARKLGENRCRQGMVALAYIDDGLDQAHELISGRDTVEAYAVVLVAHHDGGRYLVNPESLGPVGILNEVEDFDRNPVVQASKLAQQLPRHLAVLALHRLGEHDDPYGMHYCAKDLFDFLSILILEQRHRSPPLGRGSSLGCYNRPSPDQGKAARAAAERYRHSTAQLQEQEMSNKHLPGFPYGAVYFRKSGPPREDWARDYATAAEDG
ncbi:MAG: hypothetical protein MUF84_05780, partial [Anaerolineae bacterium]|nr:hypothetical protein [Anaerolineae bacterium]